VEESLRSYANPIWGAAEFAKENLNVAAQFRDYATTGERNSPEDMDRARSHYAEGALPKLAVSRERRVGMSFLGMPPSRLPRRLEFHGANVDLPVHGSRFDAAEKWERPAILDLEAAAPSGEKPIPDGWQLFTRPCTCI